MNYSKYIGLVCLSCIATSSLGQSAGVEVYLNFRHEVGGIDSFDRSKFISLHSGPTENEWNHGTGAATNFTENLMEHFIDGYDVYFGRNTGPITWYLTNRIEQDSARPGFSLESSVQYWGSQIKSSYEGKTHLHPYESKSERMIVAAQLFPFYPGGSSFPGDPTSSRQCGPSDAKWDFSTTDTVSEPFGTASGEYMARYLKYAMGGSGETGQPRPGYFTIVNEPLYWLSDVHNEPPAKVFDYFNTCAAEVRKELPDMKIAGYTTAHPNFEIDDFQRWEERWKSFIDMSGTNMDLWCIHLYDNAGNQGIQTYRRGSNVEATFDMIEQYSQMALGEQKPFIISEYGATYHDYSDYPWSPWKDWLGLKSHTALMMSFMDRPHLIEKSIPFIMLKAEWAGFDPPHGSRLLRKAWEGEGETGEHWVYTEMVKFFQLWSDVNGTRIDTYSTEADVLVDAYADGNKVYVILNNLEFSDQTIDLNLIDDYGFEPQSVRVKHLYLNEAGTAPVLDDYTTNALRYIELGAEAAMILEYTFDNPVNIDQSSIETKYYATDYLKEIEASTPELFYINGVSKGSYGEAVLRVSFGRDHGASLQPTVLFNGAPLTIPDDWKGDGQSQKDRFFGMLEIHVPNNLIQSSNTVSVEFPDAGGHISSVTMQVFEFSDALEHGLRYSIPVYAHELDNDNLIMNIQGPPNGYFALQSKASLLDTSWTTNQTDLPLNTTGLGSVTNPMTASSEFYRTVEVPAPVAPPTEIAATFDWAEHSGSWWASFGYTETENGVTMVSRGRATANESGGGCGYKATYYQDEEDGSYVMQVNSLNQRFTADSIDIKAGTSPAPQGSPLIKGMLGSAEQWTIDPVENGSFHTYTSATTGSMSNQIDQIIWEGPYDPANPSTLLNWDNAIDNLEVRVEVP